MFPSSGSYPELGGCSKGENEPYALRSSSSSPVAQHGPEVLLELAS